MVSLPKDLYIIFKSDTYRNAPHCLICGFLPRSASSQWDISTYDFLHPTPGPIYPAEDMESSKFYRKKVWWNTYRMVLYDPGDGMCWISGVKLHDEFTQCIPVDEDDGFYYRDWNTVQDPRMVAPRILSPSTTPKELAGYYIHSRCWELLSHHELRTVAERDMNTLRLALRTKYTQTGYQPKCWNPDASQEDPVRTKRVSDAISSALKQGRRRKTTKKKKKGKRQPAPQKARVGSCNLPLELLYMIFDYLPSQTVAFIEKELGVSMGNMYWRSRISTEFFYEIVGVDDERIDWKQLCLKLERQLATSTALVIRRYLLECMDDIMEIVRRSRSYTKWAGQQCKDK